MQIVLLEVVGKHQETPQRAAFLQALAVNVMITLNTLSVVELKSASEEAPSSDRSANPVMHCYF